MKKTLQSLSKGVVALTLALAIGSSASTHAQTKNYALTNYSSNRAENLPNAHDGDESTFATIDAYSVLLGIGPHGRIVNTFSGDLPAGTDVYFVLSEPGDTKLLGNLLGGSLGEILNGVVGALIGGIPTIEVNLISNTGSTVTSRSYVASPSSTADISIGENGLMYLRVRSTGTFRRAEIDISNPAVLLGGSFEINVHDIFYITPSADDCENFVRTKYDAEGLNLSLINTHGLPVNNAQHAIDGDMSTYSELGYSTTIGLGIGSQVSQSVMFEKPATLNEQPVITFDRNGTLLALDLLDALQIQVYNGDEIVYNDVATADVLALELLNILNVTIGTGTPSTISIPVTGPFDSIVIKYTETLSLSIDEEKLKIYDINIGPKRPELAANVIDGCNGLDVDVEVVAPVGTYTYNWYDTDLNLINTGVALDYTYPADGVTDTILVQAVNACGVTSQYNYIMITGNEATCLSSLMIGEVDLGGYITSNPLNAVLTDTFNVAQYVTPIDLVTGNYSFPSVERGVYKIYAVNHAVTLGDIISDNVVDDGHTITGPTGTYAVSGNGSPVTFGAFVITMPPLSSNAIQVAALASNGQAQINWNVTNNDFQTYTVEMSFDGVDFSNNVYTVNHTNNQFNYAFSQILDNKFDNVYYRIKAHTTNNTVLYSTIVRVSNTANNAYIVYPNPSHDVININAKGTETVKIYNNLGQLVLSQNMAQSSQIDVQALTPGFYIIHVNDNTQSHVLSFIKK